MARGRPEGVLLCAVGAPATMDEVEPFVRGLRGNRPTSPELVGEMRERYRRIGGGSPLGRISAEQAAALERHFRDGGEEVPCRYGAVVGTPSIATSLTELRDLGVSTITCVALTPYYSGWGVGRYFSTVRRLVRAARSPPTVRFVTSWHRQPKLLEAFAAGLRSARSALSVGTDHEPLVVFTAHSLPVQLIGPREPYVGHLGETRRAIAQQLGLRGWASAYQSVGSSGGPWLGPSVETLVDSLPRNDANGIVVAPFGFIADNLEILYDLDIDLRARAEARGIPFSRAPVPNVDPRLVEALATAVTDARGGS